MKSPDSNRFTLVTPKPENGVRLQATLSNQNPIGLPVGAVSSGESVECICGFDTINSNSFHIFTGDIIANSGTIDLSAEGEAYYFTCKFYDGYFIAAPDKDYDIFSRDEELRFNHVEAVDTPHS